MGKNELEVPEDLAFTRRSWVAERLGTAALALFLVGGLLGLFGSGPLTKATAASPDSGVRVEYDRFGHYDSESVLRVRVRKGTAGSSEVWIDEAYLRAVRLEQVTPWPLAVRSESGRQVYTFSSSRSASEVTVTFDVVFREFGTIRGAAGEGGGEPARFEHFVYP